MENQIKVTLIKSPIACLPAQRATVQALGFKKIHQTKIFTDCAALQGQLNTVVHMIKVEKV